MSERPDVAAFSLNDSDMLRCPYPHYRALRDDRPIYRPDGADFYLVTRYADIERISLNPEIFGNDVRDMFALDSRLADIYQAAPTLSTADGEPHRRTRNLIASVFGARRITELEPEIQLIVDMLIDRFADAGAVEFHHDFAIPLPVWVIADLLGVPREHLDVFKKWSDAIVVPVNPSASAAERDEAPGLIVDHNAYFLRRIAEKRSSPSGDLLSLMAEPVGADAGTGKPVYLTDDEILSMIQQLLSAGNETTTSAIGSGMARIAAEPETQKALQADPSLIKVFCDEILRLESPQQGLWRRVLKDVEVGGVMLPKGSLLNLRYGSANRDERHYDRPDDLDLRRGNAGSHLAFGFGIHTCLGRLLARKEMEIAFRSLLRRLTNIRLAPDRPKPEYVRSFIVRGLDAIHITFDRA